MGRSQVGEGAGLDREETCKGNRVNVGKEETGGQDKTGTKLKR